MKSSCLLRTFRVYPPPRTQDWLTAPFVLKITPLHGPHGKHRLPLLWIHVYSCVAWWQISYSSVLLLGADGMENTFSLNCCLYSCLQSCCLATRWSKPLQYYLTVRVHVMLRQAASKKQAAYLVDYSACRSLLAVAWLGKSCVLKLRQYLPQKHLKTSTAWRHIRICTFHCHFWDNLKFEMWIVIFLTYLEGAKQFMDQPLVKSPLIMSANGLNMEVKRKVVSVLS
jgi:hypothetical protein